MKMEYVMRKVIFTFLSAVVLLHATYTLADLNTRVVSEEQCGAKIKPLPETCIWRVGEVDIRAYYHDGNIPANTFDSDLNSRWSAYGRNKWIEYTFAEEKYIQKIGLAFYRGDQRQYRFKIEGTTDGENWEELFNGSSSGTTNEIEYFDIPPGIIKKILVTGNGNSANRWNAYTEIAFEEGCLDEDLDGFTSVQCGGRDCNDANSAINPLESELCGDAIDNNCDGLIDTNDSASCPVASSNNIYHVDAINGDDSTGDGSAAKPFKSYAKARALLVEGDTMRLYDGHYGSIDDGVTGSPTRPKDMFNDWVTIEAAPGAEPRFTSIQLGRDNACYFKEGGCDGPEGEGIVSMYIRFDGITVEDGVWIQGGHHVQVLNSKLHRAPPWNTSAEALGRGAISTRYASDVLIEGNEITNTAVGVGVGRNSFRVVIKNNHIHHLAHDAIMFVSGKDSVIEGNVIHNSDDGIDDNQGISWNRHSDGIQIFPEQKSHRAFAVENLTIRGNTFYDLESMGIMINSSDPDSPALTRNLVVENNIFGPARGPIFHAGSAAYAGLIFRHNTVLYRSDATYQSLYRERTNESYAVLFGDDYPELIEVYNNIFVKGPSVPAIDEYGRFDHNLYIGSVGNARRGIRRGDVVLPPSTYPYADGDFSGTLLSDSAALDAGTRLDTHFNEMSDPLEYDIHESPRDNRPDMGAYEEQGRTPAKEIVSIPEVPQNPRYFIDDFEDANLQRDPLLSATDTVGLSWVMPEGFQEHIIAYEQRYTHADRNYLTSNWNKNKGLIHTENSFNDFKFSFDSFGGYQSTGAGPIFMYQDSQNYMLVDFLSGRLLQIVGGVETELLTFEGGKLPKKTQIPFVLSLQEEANGIAISFERDGHVLFDYTSTTLPFDQGNVGFIRDWSGSSYYVQSFDNIKIERL
jgi:hypothetical protein